MKLATANAANINKPIINFIRLFMIFHFIHYGRPIPVPLF